MKCPQTFGGIFIAIKLLGLTKAQRSVTAPGGTDQIDIEDVDLHIADNNNCHYWTMKLTSKMSTCGVPGFARLLPQV